MKVCLHKDGCPVQSAFDEEFYKIVAHLDMNASTAVLFGAALLSED